MALTEQTYIDKAELLADGQIQVREKRVIMDNGKEIASSFHRFVLDPGRDTLTDVDTKTTATRSKIDVLGVATATWTPEKVAERGAKMAEQRGSQR